MISKTQTGFIATVIVAASVIGFTAEAAARPGFAPMHMQMPTRTIGTSAASIGSPAWTRLHTVAPSQFHAPLTRANLFAGRTPSSRPGFTGPAAGPAGAQFGRMPIGNGSFVDPTRNSRNGHQTQNSRQASNTQPSTNAVQGKNCSLNAIRAGLCQGR
jgi:hypothetical protein